MKFHNFVLKRTLAAVLGAAVLCAVLSSCKNFLSIGKVKEDVRDAIAYNNAQPVNVSLSCQEEEGTIFPQPTYQAKLGFAFEVQFIPNTQNYVVTDPKTLLKAVSRINDESREEYVEFTPVEQSYEDKQVGLYRINVKVIKYADDIKICTNGTLVPKVSEIYPPYKYDGYNQNTIVQIKFNKPMDPDSFGDFSCIYFESAGKDISDCYDTPFFSSDNTVLNIKATPGKKIIEQKAQNNVAEVVLKLACADLKDADGLSIAQIEPYTYCVKKNTDEDPPEITGFEITTTADTNAWYYRTLTDKIFGNWNDSQELNSDGTVKYYHGDYSRNHVGKTVHIELQGYDNLDVYGVRIREVFVEDSSLFAAGENQEISYYDVAQTTREEDRLLYSFDFDYEFKNKQNGLVKLEISLMDDAGNLSEIKTIYVVKSSDISRKVSFTLEADSKDSLPQLVNGEYKSYLKVPENISAYEQLHYDQVYDFTIGTAEKFYGDYISTCSSFKFILYDKDNNPVTVYEKKNYQGNTETSESIKTGINAALANFPIDTYRDTKAKAVFYEENGITRELEFTIPAPGDIASIQNGQILTTKAVVLPSAYYMIYYITCEPSDGSAPKTWKQEFKNTDVTFLSNFTNNTSSTAYPFGTYKFYAKESSIFGETVAEDCKIIRAFTKPFIYEKNSTNSLMVNLRVRKKSLTYNPSKGMYDLEVNVTYPEDEYQYYLLFVAYNQIYISAEREKTISFQYFGKDYAYQCYVAKKHPQQGFVGIAIMNDDLGLSDNDDVYPPKLQFDGSGRHYYDSSYFYIDHFKIVNNNNSNSTNQETGDVEFICYYLPGYVGETPTVDVLKAQAVYSRKIELGTDWLDNSFKSAKIPFGDLNLGEYHLYAYLKDETGNESCERLIYTYNNNNISTVIYNGVLFALRDAAPTARYLSSSKKIIIDPPAGTNDNQVRMYRFRLKQETGTNNGYWEPMENVSWNKNEYFYRYSSAKSAFSYEEDYFIKVTTSEREINKNDNRVKFDFYHYKPLYYYANYKKDPSSYPCNEASWVKVSNGWQIFRDAPVFVHTMYSAKKITETSGDAESIEWEARANETGIVVYTNKATTDFTYRNDYLTEIPDNSWYTTICHFADGTVLMSPVEQMHR